MEEFAYKIVFNNGLLTRIPDSWLYLRFILLALIWFVSTSIELVFRPTFLGSGMRLVYIALLVIAILAAIGIRKGGRDQNDDLLNISTTFFIITILGLILFWILMYLMMLIAFSD